MAVVVINLTTAGDSTDRATYILASLSPSNNALVLLWVYTIASASPTVPIVSGNNLTWSQVATVTDGSVRRMTLFCAMGARPAVGTPAIDCGGQTQTGAAWSVVQCSGADTSGANGTGAIAQAASNFSVANTTNLTVTLAQQSSPGDAVIACFGCPLNTSFTPGSGYTQAGARHQATPNLGILSEWSSATTSTAAASWSPSSVPATGIAVGVKAGAPPTSSGFMGFL